MPNTKTKVLGSIVLLTSLISSHAFSAIQILGSESEISQSLTEHYQQPTQYYNGNLADTDALYINVGNASEDEISTAKSHVVKGDTVIIDLSFISGDDSKIKQSQNLTGLGISAPVVVAGLYQGDSVINAIVSDVTDENGNPINNPSAELKSINQSLIHALDRLGFGGK